MHSRSRKCIFVGYAFGKKGYKVYDVEAKEIFVSWDIAFHENIFPFRQPEHTLIDSESMENEALRNLKAMDHVCVDDDLVLKCYGK